MRLFHKALFQTSVAELSTLPTDSVGEIAFAGRSNAGKSSAINTLAGRTRLAFVSKTPGRTQLLNFFTVAEGKYLVDLPGYGYAKVPMATRAPWGRLIGDYLATRSALKGLVVIMDARLPLTELDWSLLRWFEATGKPILVLLTKADKLSRQEASATQKKVNAELATMAVPASAQLFSSLKKQGMEQAEAVFSTWMDMTLPEKIRPPATPLPPPRGQRPKRVARHLKSR